MKPIITRTLLVLVAAVTVADPAAAANKEQKQMMADIRMLQEQAQQLQNLIGSLTETMKATMKETMTETMKAVSAVNARLDDQAVATRKAVADQKLVIDNLTNDLRIVREKVDDNNVRVSSLTQELGSLREAVVQLAAARPPVTTDSAEAAAPVNDAAPADGNAATGSPVVQPRRVVAAGTSPAKLFDAAHADYFSGQWDLAIQGFESYILTNPTSDMADDAQVLIGNSYLQDGKNEKAVEAYDKALRTYPTGDAISEAYYKKGLALVNLKQADAARVSFDYVVKTYADSPAALLAKQSLAKLATPPGK